MRRVADAIFQGFNAYRQAFQTITDHARQRFENGDWHAVQLAHSERLALYKKHTEEVARRIRHQLDENVPDAGQWHATRKTYLELIGNQYSAELFETFYNSIHRQLSDDVDLSNLKMFVNTCYPTPPIAAAAKPTRIYTASEGFAGMMQQMTADLPIRTPWRNLQRDIDNVLNFLAEERPEITNKPGLSLELLIPVFYRNKG
ncbi:MAG: isocitrate dehydrogenase kinase/phosphatase AceK regulatory subunit, partial [Pseudomonadales bacterium]